MRKAGVMAVAALLVAGGVGASEKLISVKPLGTDSLAGLEDDVAYGLRPVNGANWFKLTEIGEAKSGVLDQDGTLLAGVTVAASGAGFGYTGAAVNGGYSGKTTGSPSFFYAYLNDDPAAGTPTITIGGLLPQQGYGTTCTVYVLMSANDNAVEVEGGTQASGFYPPIVNGTRYSWNGSTGTARDYDWDGTWGWGGNVWVCYNPDWSGWMNQGYNCFPIPNVPVNSDGTVVIETGRSDDLKFRGGIAGIQIAIEKNPYYERTVSINMAGDTNGAVSGDTKYGIVAVPGNYWVNLYSVNNTAVPGVLDQCGQELAGLTVSTTGDHFWHAGSSGLDKANLFYNYIDDTSESITVGGITAANGFESTCTVHVFMNSDSSNAFYPPAVNGTHYGWNGSTAYAYQDGASYSGWGSASYNWNDAFIDARLGYNTLTIEGVAVSDSGTVTISGIGSDYSIRGGLAGLQVTVRETLADESVYRASVAASAKFSALGWSPAGFADWSLAAGKTAILSGVAEPAAEVTLDQNIKLSELNVDKGTVWLAPAADVALDIGRLTIAAGATAGLRALDWTALLENSGTLAVAGTSSISLPQGSTATGTVTLEEGAKFTVNSSSENKRYNLTGPANGQAEVTLASDCSWGFSDGSSFRNLQLVVPAQQMLWLERSGALDASVDVVLNDNLHIGNPSWRFDIGSLAGGSDVGIQCGGGTTLALHLDRAASEFSGAFDSELSLEVNGAHPFIYSGTAQGRLFVEAGATAVLKGATVADVAVEGGTLAIGLGASAVGNVTFGEGGAIAVLETSEGRGTLHSTGTVDLANAGYSPAGVSSRITVMTADGGFTNVPTRKDAAGCVFMVVEREGLATLVYGPKSGMTVVLR